MQVLRGEREKKLGTKEGRTPPKFIYIPQNILIINYTNTIQSYLYGVVLPTPLNGALWVLLHPHDSQTTQPRQCLWWRTLIVPIPHLLQFGVSLISDYLQYKPPIESI